MSNAYNLSASSTQTAPLQWTYQLTIVLEDGQSVIVGYPLTIEFNIVRDTQASTNTGIFSIYNLSYSTREKMFKDRLNTGIVKGIIFEAGYEGNLSTIFKGNIQECYSRRSGSDIITEIQAWDIGMGESQIGVTFESGTSFKDAYKNIISNSDIKLGSIGSLLGQFKQPATFIGSPFDIANQISGGHSFIDNGIIHTLQDNECLDVGVMVLNSNTGLLGTPLRRNAQVEVESVFRPEILVGQLLEIQSVTSSEFDGTYVVLGIQHTGTISGSVAGTRKTILNLMNGKMLYNSLSNLTDGEIDQPFNKVKGEDITPVNNSYGSSVAEVMRYIRNNQGNIPNKKINPMISWKDMLLPSGTRNTTSQILAQVDIGILNNCKITADNLYNYCVSNGITQGININSGWRSKENNAYCVKHFGGSEGSLHLLGKAIDFNFRNGVNVRQTYNKYFSKTWTNYTYANSSKNFIHIQITGKNPHRTI